MGSTMNRFILWFTALFLVLFSSYQYSPVRNRRGMAINGGLEKSLNGNKRGRNKWGGGGVAKIAYL